MVNTNAAGIDMVRPTFRQGFLCKRSQSMRVSEQIACREVLAVTSPTGHEEPGLRTDLDIRSGIRAGLHDHALLNPRTEREIES